MDVRDIDVEAKQELKEAESVTELPEERLLLIFAHLKKKMLRRWKLKVLKLSTYRFSA